MSKNKGNKEWKELKNVHWGQNIIVDTQEWGYIDFSPDGRKEVLGGEKLTYEEYLDAQMAIGRNIRGAFFLCHHGVPLGFAGQIERITPKNICVLKINRSICYYTAQGQLQTYGKGLGCPFHVYKEEIYERSASQTVALCYIWGKRNL